LLTGAGPPYPRVRRAHRADRSGDPRRAFRFRTKSVQAPARPLLAEVGAGYRAERTPRLEPPEPPLAGARRTRGYGGPAPRNCRGPIGSR